MLISPTPEQIRGLNSADLDMALALREAVDAEQAKRLFYSLYPESETVWRGPSIMGGQFVRWQKLHPRAKYPKQIEFFDASREYREICLMAGNRGGKTIAGGYALAAHLTGIYDRPGEESWWTGRRFDQPITAWAAGDTYETTRDILQLALLGDVSYQDGRKGFNGHGIIPGHLLGRNSWRSGVQDLVDTIAVKHVSGGWSFLGFRSYDQGRKAFQGTARHVILVDEEPPMDVYNEMLVRTATVSGIIMLTFTPLSGLSEVVLSFMPADQRPDF